MTTYEQRRERDGILCDTIKRNLLHAANRISIRHCGENDAAPKGWRPEWLPPHYTVRTFGKPALLLGYIVESGPNGFMAYRMHNEGWLHLLFESAEDAALWLFAMSRVA